MSDDDLEVTEHDETKDEVDFSDAFSSASEGDAPETEAAAEPENDDLENGDTDEPEAGEKNEEEQEDGKEPDGDPKKDADKEGDAKEEDDTSDEDKAAAERGKALIEEEEKAKKAEEDRKAEEERLKAEAEAAKKPEIIPLDANNVKTFIDLVDPSALPESVEIDGATYNVREVLEDSPELAVVAGYATQRVLERLVENDVLVTTEVYSKKIQDIEDRIYGLYFDTTVMREIPDVMKIAESEEFGKWMKESATKEEIALLGSRDPGDYVLGLRRYLKASGQQEKEREKEDSAAKEAAKKAAKKEADKKKKDHQSIHASSNRPSRSGLMDAIEGGANEFSDAFKEAQSKEGE